MTMAETQTLATAGIVDEPERHALVMRYYKRGTLAQAFQHSSYQALDMAARVHMAHQVATGVQYLHEAPRNIIHGDLKTSNLLLEDDGRVVITDFGLAHVQGGSLRSNALTVSISPPEVLQNPSAPRDPAVDVYAYGIVLLELLQGRPAFRGDITASELTRAIAAGHRPPIPREVPERLQQLITACWAQDPAARPAFSHVCREVMAVLNSMGGSRFGNTTTTTTTTIIIGQN